MIVETDSKFSVAYVATELHLEQRPDGAFYTPNRAAAYDQFARYLSIAKEVRVVARVGQVIESSSDVRVDGVGVSVEPVPEYQGLKQLLSKLPQLALFLLKLESRSTVAIGRLPEVLSLLLWANSSLRRIPFVAFVVADADVLGETLGHSLRLPVIGRLLPKITRKAINSSVATIYVTRCWLQERFPPPPHRPTISRSNVVLGEGAFAERHELPSTRREPVLVSVGTMGSSLKGQDALIRMLPILRDKGVAAKLLLVGDGPLLPQLESLAVSEGVRERVEFVGNVANPAKLRGILDSADLFVSASRTEGLPRATIEAMARSLPVVSTRAGGVSELLEETWIVDVDDVYGLAEQCARVLASPELGLKVGKRNLDVAKDIAREAAESRLIGFLQENVVSSGSFPQDQSL